MNMSNTLGYLRWELEQGRITGKKAWETPVGVSTCQEDIAGSI